MSAKVVTLSKYEAGQASPYHQNPPRSQAADIEIGAAGVRLRDWARHLADNSSIVCAVLSSRTSNAIGPGLSYEPLVRDRKGRLLPEINDVLRRIHQRWSRAVDVTGELSRHELERLVWRTWDIDGEAFIRAVIRRPQNARTSLPYQLQVLETDWVPFWLTQETTDGTYLVHGIEKDEWGRPLRYYIDATTNAMTYGATALDPKRMTKLEADNCWHLKRQMRPNQTRGVTLFHPIIFRTADIAQYQAAHRLAARASADLFASINRSPDVDLSSLSSSEEDASGKRIWSFEHLQILDELLPGETVNFHTPAHPNQNAVEFVREELRAIASACDVGFSQIAQVFDSSYAAQRLEVVDTWRKVERDRAKFINDFARPALYERVVDMAQRSGLLPARALRRADPDTLMDVRIDGPTMPVIDPVKDRQAFALDQENGWDSRHGIIRRMGKQPRDVDAEREADDAMPEPVEAAAPTTDDDGMDAPDNLQEDTDA